MAGALRIGVSGWRYDDWRGSFYPDHLPRSEELSYASSRFGALELNGTFYSLQSPESFGQWYAQTPRGFRFAVKGSRYVTHMKRIDDVATALANFFASGVLRLEEKLGPVLWQLPARLPFDADRLDRFLAQLPHDFSSAAKRARRHDDRLPHRAWLRFRTDRRIRHALEVRHESFLCPEFVDILRRHRVGLVASHTVGRWPYVEELTAHFAYLRLHGPGALYASRYDEQAIAYWAERAEAWQRGEEPEDAEKITDRPPPGRGRRDVWVFFDNTDKRHAPEDARALIRATA